MPINRPGTKRRNIKADQRRIRGTGLATGAVGQALRTRHTTPLTEYLEKVLAERPTARKREIKSLTPAVFEALEGIPKDVIADAMLRGCIDCHHIIGQDAPPKVFTAMGDVLQTEARGIAVRKALGAKEYARLQRLFARKASTYKKLRVEYAVLRENAITVEPWPRNLLALVGAFACDMLLQALPDVIAVDDYDLPRMSEEAARAIDVDLYAHPIYEPSATPPFPWSGLDGIDGDQFVANCRNEKAVRVAIASGIPHVDAVNYLRLTRFRINEHVLDVVKNARPLLKKVKGDGPETLLKQNLAMADRWVGRPFHVPVRIDFRGRLIAGPNLNYTAPDHIRGLFQFGQTAPLGERGLYWLKLACSTAYDALPEGSGKLTGKKVSKLVFPDRLEWADANIERIRLAGLRPLDHVTWLEKAADPVQCVALFAELANAIEHGPGYHCSVPIGFDASCSGLQHVALLARDLQAARLTNLVPSNEGPQDIYDFVQVLVQRALAKASADGTEWALWWLDSGHLDRTILKALVMTYGYSAREWGQRSGVHNELRDRGVNYNNDAIRELMKLAVKELVKLVRKAIEILIPAAPAVMKALQALVTNAPVTWTSPSGLPVSNSYPKPKTSTVRLYMLGRSKRSVISVGWKHEQRLDKARSSIAPNYIHSLDAAHLARVANACARRGIPLTTVHDSYSTLPPYADRLRDILREELREMYRGYEALVQPTGDLNLNDVIGDYAFS